MCIKTCEKKPRIITTHMKYIPALKTYEQKNDTLHYNHFSIITHKHTLHIKMYTLNKLFIQLHLP